MTQSTTISPHQLAELFKVGRAIDLIDVRTPVEYREVHIDFARNISLDQLDPQTVMQARNGSKDESLYVVCRSGIYAIARLKVAGIKAESPQDAARKAERMVNLHQAIAAGDTEYAEEIEGFLVDLLDETGQWIEGQSVYCDMTDEDPIQDR